MFVDFGVSSNKSQQRSRSRSRSQLFKAWKPSLFGTVSGYIIDMMRLMHPPKSSAKFKDPEPASPKMFVQRYREPRGHPGPQQSLREYEKVLKIEKAAKAKRESSKAIKIEDSTSIDVLMDVEEAPGSLPDRTKESMSGCDQVETIDTFYPFRKLPTEIRDLVWELALPGPRTVKVKTMWLPRPKIEHKFNTRARAKKEDDIEKSNYEYATSKAIAETPVLLHVCKESREFALKSYVLSFERQLAKKPIYLNFKIDTLYFQNWQMFFDFTAGSMPQAYRKDVVGKLKHLVIGGHLCYPGPDTTFKHKQLGWETLETLTLLDSWCSVHEIEEMKALWEEIKGEEGQIPMVKYLSLEELVSLAKS